MAVVGVDIGTQSLKVVVCADDLRLLASASRSYGYDVPRPGWAEQDPSLWLDALTEALVEALAASEVAPGAVLALGLAGQLDGCVPVDGEGAPTGNALIWMDRRAAEVMPALDADDFRHRTGQVADPGHMAAKVRWLKQRGHAAARFHQPVSFVLEALTGANVFDRGLASTTMLYNQVAGDYDDDLLAAFGVDRSELPSIGEATDQAGTLRRALGPLRAGTPVCVGTGDDFATPLGAGLLEPGPLVCVLGTAEVVGRVTAGRVLDPSGLLETHDYFGGRFFLENPGWLAGGSVRWGLSLLGLDHSADLDRLADTSEPGARGVTFLPALSGAMAPRWEPGARGCLYGLSAATSRGDVARAILEGCAFAMTDVAQTLDALGQGADEIVLLGGGARSALWRQIRADASGLPVRAGRRADECATGAAALAAISASAFGNIESAASRLHILEPPEPPRLARRDVYDTAHARYRALFESLTPLFD